MRFSEKHLPQCKSGNFIDKPERHEQKTIEADYVGVKSSNKFVVSYGLDFKTILP